MRVVDEALTFDDVLLVPGYSEVLPHEVDLSAPLTRGIALNIPLLSSAGCSMPNPWASIHLTHSLLMPGAMGSRCIRHVLSEVSGTASWK